MGTMGPYEAIDLALMDALRAAARLYLARHGWEGWSLQTNHLGLLAEQALADVLREAGTE